jgi:hypothetical protein
MAVTLSTVFHHFGGNLSVASLFGLSEATLSKSINAVNFTNLINPSPFIANKTLILTTGHLLERNLNRYTALSYLRNLTVRDVPAVIIGPEEINFSKKADMSFLEKCRRLAEFLSQSEVSVGTRIPIFVSQDISFIEMTKYIDSLIVQDTNQQINRIAAAKQVLSKTAFESNSASPVFSKLESQLHTWALCFDSQGMLLSHSESFEHQYGQHYGIVQKQVRKLLYGNRKSACEIEKSGFLRASGIIRTVGRSLRRARSWTNRRGLAIRAAAYCARALSHGQFFPRNEQIASRSGASEFHLAHHAVRRRRCGQGT